MIERYTLRYFYAKAAEYFCHNDSKILEIGAGDSFIIASIFKDRGEYYRTDIDTFDILRMHETIQNIPYKLWDVIVVSQVIEHVYEPLTALKNIRSMLNFGGVVIGSCPFWYRIHHDNKYDDLWRFTDRGMKLLLYIAGFEGQWVLTLTGEAVEQFTPEIIAFVGKNNGTVDDKWFTKVQLDNDWLDKQVQMEEKLRKCWEI